MASSENMSESRSVVLHREWLTAASKFDYAITGISVALVAYLGARGDVVRFGLDGAGFEAAGLVLILASGVAGFKRIESTIAVISLNSAMLKCGEEAGEVAAALHTPGGGTFVNKESGDVMTGPQLAVLFNEKRVMAATAEHAVKKEADRAAAWYRRRNWLLWLGLLALAASRIAPGYL
jgi:hypothetical protein